MDPIRWQQIDKLLDEALDRPPEGRKAFLEQACGGDEDLRKQVEELLAAHEKAGSYVETPPWIWRLELWPCQRMREERTAKRFSNVGHNRRT